MITAVVVTRDRLKLLKECIAALRNQTRRPDFIIVIANDPSTEVREWLATQTDLNVFFQENLGSAGGQKRGIYESLLIGADWIWCMDDDSLPTTDALARLCDSPKFLDVRTGFLASVVLWKDDTAHNMNLMNPTYVGKWISTILTDKSLPVSSCSFVGVMFSAHAARHVGLPIEEMFIWGDDIEYTRRISSSFECYGVLDSIVYHQTVENSGSDSQIPEAGPTPIKIKCLYRNGVALELLSNRSLLIRLKNIAVWILRESSRSKTLHRKQVIIYHALVGFGFYYRYCRNYRLTRPPGAGIKDDI